MNLENYLILVKTVFKVRLLAKTFSRMSPIEILSNSSLRLSDSGQCKEAYIPSIVVI